MVRDAARPDFFARVRIAELRLNVAQKHGRVHGRDDRPSAGLEDTMNFGEESVQIAQVFQHESAHDHVE